MSACVCMTFHSSHQLDVPLPSFSRELPAASPSHLMRSQSSKAAYRRNMKMGSVGFQKYVSQICTTYIHFLNVRMMRTNLLFKAAVSTSFSCLRVSGGLFKVSQIQFLFFITSYLAFITSYLFRILFPRHYRSKEGISKSIEMINDQRQHREEFQ